MKTSSERTAFSTRLQQALRNANHAANHPTYLSREFNFRFSGSPITVHAARKWLVGESIPTQDKLRALANWLNVTAEWLRFGGPEENAATAALQARDSPESAQSKLIADFMDLDEHHRQIVQDFIRMLAQKGRHAGSAPSPERAPRVVKLKIKQT
ncbi:transcriptional regulator with XRE-family HTH domain [Actimicrobium sp. GrIS 1.19]|uniref:hypothetical protein n=1 Tax=Actimicrobium sp. GrIS 1.19 TaxID=3071708 RepID=UPI002DFCBFDC|nr:transcriptional regulator with XRE-family HTH domain [Actimicrobium sp. GrIS 1.19]